MKKLKFLSLLCSAIMVFSFGVFAEEVSLNETVTTETTVETTTTTNEAVEDVEKRKKLSDHSEDLEIFFDTVDTADFVCEGRFENGFPFSNFKHTNGFSEEQKSKIYNFFINIDQTETEEITAEEFSSISKRKYDNMVKVRFEADVVNPNGKNGKMVLGLYCYNGYATINFSRSPSSVPNSFYYYYRFKMSDKNKIMESVKNLALEISEEAQTGVRFVENIGTVYSENFEEYLSEYEFIETLTFDITLDNSFFGTVFEEICGDSNVLNCEIKHYLKNQTSVYVITFKGDEEITIFHSEYNNKNLEFYSGAGYRNYIKGIFQQRVRENQLLLVNDKYSKGEFGIMGSSSDGKNITELKFMLLTCYGDSIGRISYSPDFDGYYNMEYNYPSSPNPVYATNIKYEVAKHIDASFKGINLGVRFGIPINAVTNEEFKGDGNITEDQYYTKENIPSNNKDEEEETEDTENTEKEETVEKAPEVTVKNNATAAEKLESLGLLKGTDKGIELEKEFNRAEAATMLVRLSGKEKEVTELRQAENEFSDMENHWAADYVSYCYEQGITKGTSETTYSPENNITAREYLTLVMRLMGYTEAEPETVDELAKTYIITDEAKLKEILSGSFTRDKMAYISFALLTSETTDGEILINELIATGAVDSSKAAEIFN